VGRLGPGMVTYKKKITKSYKMLPTLRTVQRNNKRECWVSNSGNLTYLAIKYVSACPNSLSYERVPHSHLGNRCSGNINFTRSSRSMKSSPFYAGDTGEVDLSVAVK
jgi:hypothetical protein